MRTTLAFPGLLLLLLAASSHIHATKPCPPSPCEGSSHEFDRARCSEAASWIAVGTMSGVIHHPEPPPLSKDFAEFTFTVKVWEKGSGKVGQQFRFKTGWCENGQELPKDTSGPLRVFGAPPASTGENRYLFLESLSTARPRR